MFGSQGWLIAVAVFAGSAAGYAVGARTSVDEQQLASILKSQFEATRLRHASPQSGDSTIKLQTKSEPYPELAGDEFRQLLSDLRLGLEKMELRCRDIFENARPLTAEQPGRASAQLDEYQLQSAVQEADRVLADALSKGIWEASDAQRYGAVTQNLPPNELVDVYKKLAIAVNSGRLKLEPGAM